MDPLKNGKLLYLCVAGSRLYGTASESSDYDYRGVVIPDPQCILGFKQGFEQAEHSPEIEKEFSLKPGDLVLYDLRKFCKLVTAQNPNIIELLFAPSESIIYESRSFSDLKRAMKECLSQNLYNTFRGYIEAQTRKLYNSRKWLTSGRPSSICDPNYQDYSKWLSSRNPKRAELEKLYGYDTKFASHIIRLYLELNELSRTGKIVFPLVGSPVVRAIRNGSYSFEEFEIMRKGLECSLSEIKVILPKQNTEAITSLDIRCYITIASFIEKGELFND